MSGASSYSGGQNRRQIARTPIRVAAAIFAAAALGACSSLGLPFGPDVGVSTAATGGLAEKSSATDAVATSDWDIVRKTIATIPPGQAKTAQWVNPVTGSSGALTVVAATATPPPACRPFSTTVSDPRGVRRYRGQACRQGDGGWQLVGLAADDTLLS